MSIRSVDMQMLVQKAGDVARVQQTHQVDTNRQQEYAQNITNQTERVAKSVEQPLHNEGKMVHEKEEQEKNSKKRSRSGGKESEEENKKPEGKAIPTSLAGHKLDITV